jgi:hypothetical protein
MKTIIFFLVILLSSISGAFAIHTWYDKGDSTTMGWDASMTPLSEGEDILYYLYTKNEDGSDVMAIDSTTGTIYIYRIPRGSVIIPGVSAVIVFADGTESEESEISWADNIEAVENGVTFGFVDRRKIPPGKSKK